MFWYFIFSFLKFIMIKYFLVGIVTVNFLCFFFVFIQFFSFHIETLGLLFKFTAYFEICIFTSLIKECDTRKSGLDSAFDCMRVYQLIQHFVTVNTIFNLVCELFFFFSFSVDIHLISFWQTFQHHKDTILADF